ncbi:MAG: nucleoside recognition domain-containing protein [Burkholderiales bacterium]
MLNAIWVGFFLVAFVVALARFVFQGDSGVFVEMTQSTFATSKAAFEIALGLTGVMTLWLGIMRIGERAGFLELLTRALTPLLKRLFPEVPANHPALGSMVMNMGANMLGLDNAATPMGLKAMRELQTLNPSSDTASNAQILFLVINTSSVTIFPITIFTYRAQLGAADPTDVFIPILLATFSSTALGVLATGLIQRLKLWDVVIFAYFGVFTLLVAGMALYFAQLSPDQMRAQSAFISNFLLFSLIIAFIVGAALRRVNVYETFIEGAKDGFHIAIGIIPYLVAMLVAIGVFRASGAMEMLLGVVRRGIEMAGWDTRFVDGLPTALMKPLTGSGARAMMIDAMRTHGADSFAGRLASIVQGSTETTFYVLALYFGSVGIKRVRHAVGCGLLADAAGIIAAILVAYLFFG